MTVSQKKYTIDGTHCKYGQFTYLVPIEEEIQLIPEPTIAEKYTLATCGYREGIFRSTLKTETKVDILVRTRDNVGDGLYCRRKISWQLWLIANNYTMAKLDKMIGFEEITILAGLFSYAEQDRIMKEFIRRTLRG